jgi:hypothetical protein
LSEKLLKHWYCQAVTVEFILRFRNLSQDRRLKQLGAMGAVFSALYPGCQLPRSGLSFPGTAL